MACRSSDIDGCIARYLAHAILGVLKVACLRTPLSMRQLVAIFLSVAVIAGEVSAQGFSPYPQDQATILTEAQKRRMLLPYVRALTDCFAREIAGNQSAFLHAQQNRWYDALVTTGTACEPFLSTMVREHDRLHGLGTGSAFFKGAYIQDLPRALNVRLKSEMEKRAVEAARIEAAKKAELARQEAERKIQIDHAERAFNLLRQKMYECTTGPASRPRILL